MKKFSFALVLGVLSFALPVAGRATTTTPECPVLESTPAAPETAVPAPVASAATGPDAAMAQPAPTNAELAAEVAQLKTSQIKWEKFLAAMPRITGYVQLGYEWSEDESTFFIKSARVCFSGDITPKIDYRLQLELASPKIVDAYVRYRPLNELNFQLGQYKLPFSIENTDYVPLKFEFIEYPLSLCKLMGFNDMCGLAAGGRDLGAMLYGGFVKRDGYSVINYDLGVFNGEGINSRDKNTSKDIVGRLMIKPVRGLTFAGSYYWGEYGKDYLKRVRYGLGACYDRGAGVVRGEYLRGTTGTLESEGWYAMAGWRATKSLMASARYDTFTDDVAKRSTTRQTNYTAGLTWQPVKYLRCQANYTYEDYNAPEAKNRNVIALLVTGIF